MTCKKLLCSLLLFALVLSLSACNSSSSLDKTIDNSVAVPFQSGVELISEGIPSAQPSSEVIYLITKISYLDDNLSVLYANTYEYNDEGNIITSSYDRYYTDAYEYNEQGSLITITHYAGGEISSRDEYEYNDSGLISKCISYYKQVNDFITAEYEYDSLNRKIRMTYTKLSSSVGGPFYDCTYEYDGDTVLSETQISEGQVKQYTEYDYDKNQKCITIYNNDGTITFNEWYLTEADDICLKQVIYNEDGSTEEQVKTELEYDSRGNLIKGICYWYNEFKYSFGLEYDDRGNLLRQTYYDQMGFVKSETQYEYKEFFVKN